MDLTEHLTTLDLPAGPFLPVLRVDLTDVEVHESALGLADAIGHAYPHAGPLIVLGPGAELTAMDDEDLARLGLMRTPKGPVCGTCGRVGLVLSRVAGVWSAGCAAGHPLVDDGDLTIRLDPPDTPATEVDEIPDGERQPE